MSERVKFDGNLTAASATAHIVGRMTSRLTARAAARHLGIRRSTLIAWNECGVGPLPDERGRWDLAAVVEWVDEMSTAVFTMERC